MVKSLRNVLQTALSLCIFAGLMSIISERASAQCFAFRLANNGKYLTSDGSALRVRPGNNQANQIFRIESVGEYKRITPHGTLYEGANAVTRRWDNEVTTVFLYRGADEQLWRQKPLGDNIFGFIQKNSNMGFGCKNWGEGVPGDFSDVTMVPESDVDIYGPNKFILEPKTCPASSGACDFNITLTTSNPNPQVGVPFTLTANCVGSGCSGVAYEWAGNGQETGIYGNPATVIPQFAMTIDHTVIASKDGSGCTYKSAHLRLTAQTGDTNPPAFSQCIESENSNGTGSISSDPNASNGSTRGDEFDYNKYVDYVVSNVPAAGTYKLKLRYYAASQPSINVSVAASGFSQTFQIPATDTWNIVWREETINVNLSAGTNTIRIQGVGGGSCRQDKICVTDPNSGARIAAGGSMSQDETSSDLQVFPNPSKGEFEMEFYLEKGEPADLTVTNVAGQTLQKRSVTGSGLHREKFDIGSAAPGMYLINVIRRNAVDVKKILINK